VNLGGEFASRGEDNGKGTDITTRVCGCGSGGRRWRRGRCGEKGGVEGEEVLKHGEGGK
jgi:hypothetical protein